MNHHDPEPDRDEAASRPSEDWQRMATVAPLLDSLDAILDSLGCKNGLHDWDGQFTGDPPGTPNRRLDWSRTRLVCADCGQSATLTLDAPPATAPDRDPSDHELLLTTDQAAQALIDGRDGSNRLVKMRSMPASLLWMSVRKALDRMGAER